MTEALLGMAGNKLEVARVQMLKGIESEISKIIMGFGSKVFLSQANVSASKLSDHFERQN